MNRRDLRTSEQEWRATPQRKFEVPQAPPKRVKVLTVLKILAVVIALVVLADSQMKCESMFGANSKLCVD